MEDQPKSYSTHYQKYKDAIKQRALDYYYANKEARLKANREYKIANKEKLAEQQRVRRQRARQNSTEGVPSEPRVTSLPSLANQTVQAIATE